MGSSSYYEPLRLKFSPLLLPHSGSRKYGDPLCIIVGVAGSAFPVDIEINEKTSVGELKERVKAGSDGIITVPYPNLQLFLAKAEGDAWLPSLTEDVKKLKKGEKTALIEALMKEDQELQAEDSLKYVLDENNMPTPQSRQIHVLVVVPEPDNIPSPSAVLLEAILPHVLTSASTTLTDRNKGFKDELCNLYKCYRRKKSWVQCMLLDVAFPKSLMIASHLFRCSNEYLSLVMMQISDIDDVKNGLLLFKPLEHAFDHHQISFIRDDTDGLRLKLFDPCIRDTRLIDLMDRNGKEVLSAQQTQARVARMKALNKKAIDSSYDFKDFWSEVSLDDKMDIFHRSILNSNALQHRHWLHCVPLIILYSKKYKVSNMQKWRTHLSNTSLTMSGLSRHRSATTSAHATLACCIKRATTTRIETRFELASVSREPIVTTQKALNCETKLN
ncbi:unnamed protein product [Phytophthora lilii]|uniref:Unnamed protein product n=1 Tax=Phytophthora lilii TaxID=2077276 RepID=A0A9W6XQP4_9STRA|nr:unnamed protein product [Phytophthora lilii]